VKSCPRKLKAKASKALTRWRSKNSSFNSKGYVRKLCDMSRAKDLFTTSMHNDSDRLISTSFGRDAKGGMLFFDEATVATEPPPCHIPPTRLPYDWMCMRLNLNPNCVHNVPSRMTIPFLSIRPSQLNRHRPLRPLSLVTKRQEYGRGSDQSAENCTTENPTTEYFVTDCRPTAISAIENFCM
jgi:hypothetical protein